MIALTSKPGQHEWKFFRAGGFDQVVLRDGADIINLDQLDQKLWVALACPTRGIDIDPKTLDFLDPDNDGRIRVPDIITAVKWVQQVYRNPDDLFKGGENLPLASINDQTPLGKALLTGASRILQNLGKSDASSISLLDVMDTARIFAATKFNGDGIVPVDAAEDQATAQVITDILSAIGGVPDRSGKPGINQAKADAFFAEAKALSDWFAKCEKDPTIQPLGEATAKAQKALEAVKAKIDDYFARSRLVAFDARAEAALNGAEAEYVQMAAKDLTIDNTEIARLPLARVGPNQPLPLREGLNPAWTSQMAAFREDAVKPLLGTTTGDQLTEADWIAVQAKLAPFQTWTAGKPSSAVEKIGLPRLREILSGSARKAIADIIQRDSALAEENAQITSLEKLLRFQRDLVHLLNNFVNFSEFYGRQGAVFQVGTLYLDSRSCCLVVSVADAAKHAALAGFSQSYLAYCDCTRPGGEKMTIAVAFTNGDSDNLMVGRNGIFYDSKGRDWDATISRIVANPISIREAFWSPYKKFIRLVETQIAKRAAEADAAANEKLNAAAVSVTEADKSQTPPAKLPSDKKFDVGTVAAIGVALGSIGTFFGVILGKFFDLGFWMPLGFVGVILMISGPSMLLAYLKLRQRNLGPILDANGWAINGRARINVAFGSALTRVASLPPGSERSLNDPYADKQQPWVLYVSLILIIVLCAFWYAGRLDKYLPRGGRSVTIMGTNAPAYRADMTATAAPAAIVEQPPAAAK